MNSPPDNDPRILPNEPSAFESTPDAELPIGASQAYDKELSVSPDSIYSMSEFQDAQDDAEPQMFQSFSAPEVRPEERIPNFGHLCLLGLLAGLGLLCTGLLTRAALAHHLFGISTLQKAIEDIHYELGTESALYLFTFIACLIIFPMVWHKSFFAGVQWNGATARRLWPRLLGAAFTCFLIALVNGLLIPGPSNTPIDQIFRAPGAAWILFGFGVTFAPFFEEMFFRGFLLPALCTAFDWTDECIFGRPDLTLSPKRRSLLSVAAMAGVSIVLIGTPAALIYAVVIRSVLLFIVVLPIAPAALLSLNAVRSPHASQFIRPLGENGHPQWSLPAMATASVATSIPFALLHAQQTGWAIGPFCLLIGVSLVLCAVRLSTRSLASSVLVHASYNFMLFSIMMLGTGGFRHLDKM
jgi:membrane protease YdiL (CAAX protease family)